MSVLRYCGGKTRAIKILDEFLPPETKSICAPFFGGGSFELHCAQNKHIKVQASDVFEPLLNFWQTLKSDKDELVKAIQALLPLTKEHFYKLRDEVLKEDSNSSSKIERAAAYFAVNRSSFSGSTCSGGFSAESATKRFTTSSIEKLDACDLSNVDFTCCDFEEAIKRAGYGATLFLDPPYALEKKGKNNLYGKQGSTHRDFDHERLRKVLETQEHFILTYNDCEYIRKLYADCTIKEVSWSYGMNKDKKSKEIVIVKGIDATREKTIAPIADFIANSFKKQKLF